MWTNINLYAIESRISFIVGNNDTCLTQRLTASYFRRRIILIGYILTNPLIQLTIKIVAGFPAANMLPLQYFNVMSKAIDHKQVRKLCSQLVVSFCLLGFRAIAKKLGFLTAVGRKERCIVGAFSCHQTNETLLSYLKVLAVLQQNFRWAVHTDFTIRTVLVHRKIHHFSATLRANNIRATAVFSKRAG